ncbi:hypothetical protein [Methylosinus sp. Sm6]|uniref:hypothetical protein n=1 Tax=Methylosinus sp. Sm6 TaxID=2866948 RepID=UPI002103275F|nr:hypothetical protein [Methylosinus sp. Sm6]
MAALQKGHLVRERYSTTTRRLPVAASTVIWEGAMVALSGSGSAAVAVPASASNTLKIVGVAMANADNRLGVDGAQSVETKVGIFLFDNAAADPIALGDIGANAYVVDDHTVARTSNSNARPVAGVIYDVEAAGVWVRFS